MELLDKFEQASKQKRMVGYAFLKFKQSKLASQVCGGLLKKAMVAKN
jgi:hypothetical protein